jgi:hypothetical protein
MFVTKMASFSIRYNARYLPTLNLKLPGCPTNGSMSPSGGSFESALKAAFMRFLSVAFSLSRYFAAMGRTNRSLHIIYLFHKHFSSIFPHKIPQTTGLFSVKSLY